MITKFNTKIINPNWAGVICLNLGSTKPDNFDEILETLKKIVDSKEHYIVSIYDTETKCYLGECELIHDYGNYISIKQHTMSSGFTSTLMQYAFYYDGTYIRSKPSYETKNEIESLKSRVTELENKINELTITQ